MVVARLVVLLAGLAVVLTTSLAASAPSPLPLSYAPGEVISIVMTGSCPSPVGSGVEQVSGLDVTESDYFPPATSAGETLLRCEFQSGGQLVAQATTVVKLAARGETAQEQLTNAISGSGYHIGQLRAIPGLGDAAEFGIVPTPRGLEGAVWVVGTLHYRFLSVQVSMICRDPYGAPAPIVAMARSLYQNAYSW